MKVNRPTMRLRCYFERVLLLCLVVGLGCCAARALDPRLRLEQYSKQSWNIENGLPQNSVHAILQTSEGFIWFGTEAGLARFDGYQFRLFNHEADAGFSGDDIRCLLEDKAGSLWVGTASGLTRLRDSHAHTFSEADGVPAGAVRSLTLAADGSVWVLTTGGVAAIRLMDSSAGKASVQSFGNVSGFSGGNASAIVSDGVGGVWIGTSLGLKRVFGKHVEDGPAALAHATIEALGIGADKRTLLVACVDGVFQIKDGALTTLSKREKMPLGGVTSLLQTNEGTWVAGRSSVTLIKAQGSVTFEAGRDLPGTQITVLSEGLGGAVWIGTNAGVARYSNGHMDSAAGLANGSAVLSIFEDRQGQLWLGSEMAGITVLRDRPFEMVHASASTSSEPVTSVLQSGQGELWTGTNGSGLSSSSGTVMHIYTARDGLASDIILALGAGASRPGELWVGTPDGLSVLRKGRWQTMTSADGLADDLVRSLLVTHDGAVWAGSRHGITRWRAPGNYTLLTTAQGLGSDLVGPMLEDAHQDVWVGTSNGLTRFHEGSAKTYTTADGLPDNTIGALEQGMDGSIWVATRGHGLSRWNGSKFFSYSSASGLPHEIYALIEDRLGSLWMTSDRGISRVPVRYLEAFEHDQNHDIAVFTLGTGDGVPSIRTTDAASPSTWKLLDGRLCFATRRGVVVIDPTSTVPVQTAPPIVFEQISVDDRIVTAEEIASVAPGASHFSFSFAGINLAAPQRVQYRYMLQGLDKAWVEAGTRRTAYYTSLPHGRYVFRVSARNAGGPWSTPAELALELRPRAYQTTWFRLLMVALAAALGFGIYRLRVQTLESRFDAVSAERNRMAREIHDTLAQSFVAVSMRLALMSRLLRSGDNVEKCREQLDQTRAMVSESLGEARRSIWDLRAEGPGAQSLPSRLARLIQDTRANVPQAAIETTGTYRPLARSVEDEIFRIAQESVANVVRHAHAQSLLLRLDYALGSLSLEVNDDGNGFDMQHVASRESGHFGLTGLRERTRILGAELKMESSPGKGTRVYLQVPLLEARK